MNRPSDSECGAALAAQAKGPACGLPAGHRGAHRSREAVTRERERDRMRMRDRRASPEYRERGRERREYSREYRRGLLAANPFYDTWKSIKQRCLNPDNSAYPIYGGRGVTIYPEWAEDGRAFGAWILANLGPRPEGCTLDRIDNDGNYEPGNLRWATAKEQTANQRRHLPCPQCGYSGDRK